MTTKVGRIRERQQRRGSVFHAGKTLVVATLLLLLSLLLLSVTSSTTTTTDTIEEPSYDSFVQQHSSSNTHAKRQLSSYQPDKWSPNKEENIGCEHYYNQTGGDGWEEGEEWDDDDDDDDDGWRQRRAQANGNNNGNNGNGNNNGRGNNNNGRGNQNNPPPPPQPCRDTPVPAPAPVDASASNNGNNNNNNNNNRPREELGKSTIAIDMSVALPSRLQQKGIPNLVTTAVKEYLSHPNVSAYFWENTYKGLHFQLDVWQYSPKSGEDEHESDGEDDNGDESDGEEDDNDNNNNRHLGEQTTIPTTAPTTTTAPSNAPTKNNTAILGLVAFKEEHPDYLAGIDNSNYGWVHHTVYLVAHDGQEKTVDGLIKDASLMSWLRKHLKQLIYDDLLLLNDPPIVGPYYDTNNNAKLYPDQNNPLRPISFLEYTIQEYGIPLGGIVPPGHESWEAIPPPYQVTNRPVPSPAPYDERLYSEPLITSELGARQWTGMACLIATVVLTILLSTVSNEIAKKREQEELWGNLRVLEEAQEDVEYLNVGWRFAGADDTSGEPQPSTAAVPENMMMMEVFDKRGVGYKEGSSLLMGGYEYKPTVAEQLQQQSQVRPPSHRVDASITPFR